MSKKEIVGEQKKRPGLKLTGMIKVLTFLLLMGIFILGTGKVGTAATGSALIISVDYLEEVIAVRVGAGNSTKYYMSIDNMKTWEAFDRMDIPNRPSGWLGKLDISPLLKTKETTIYFKGNKDTYPTPVVLKGEENALKVSYKVIGERGQVLISNTSTTDVEYRKNVNRSWKTITDTIYTAEYEAKGATLYFRTKATENNRAGKIVSLRIPKRPTAPSVKLDGSKLTITGFKSMQTQYRINDSVDWILFTDTQKKTLDVKDLFAKNQPDNTPIQAGTIEVRTAATEKKAPSAIRIIEVPAQPVVPSNLISLNGTTLTIQDSDTKRRYEYTIVKKGENLDLTKAKWKSASTTKPVVVPKIEVDDKICVRLKSTRDPVTKQVIPASTYVELRVAYLSMTD